VSKDNYNSSSVGQTSDRHSLYDKDKNEIAEVIQKHNEILRRKLELIINGRLQEARTSKIEFRTWPELKYVYGKVPQEIKTAARRAFEMVIISWFLGERQTKTKVADTGGSPIIFNLSLNINEAKATSHISIDLTEIAFIIEKLYRLKSSVPVVQRRLIEDLYKWYKRVSRLN